MLEDLMDRSKLKFNEEDYVRQDILVHIAKKGNLSNR